MKTEINLMYSVRINNPLYQFNSSETNSALISTSNLPSSNDSSSQKAKKLSDQSPKISNKSKTIDPDTDRSSYVPEKPLQNQNPSDTHTAMQKAMEDEWGKILKLRTKQNTSSKNLQINSRTSESDEIISSDSDTNVEVKTSGNSPRFEEPEKFYELGLKYYEDKNENPNFIEAAKFFTSAAKLGDSKAQYKLGEMYELGKGVQRDIGQAISWYQTAGRDGIINASLRLAEIYIKGLGVKIDLSAAASWLKDAAEAGNAKAQFELSKAYDNGRGVDKSPKKAAHWCSKAALQGDAAALFYLGLMYAYGNGVDKNHAAAANYYKLSAEKGYNKAQLTLGDAYAAGKGVKKDVAEAAKWYRKASEQGIDEATHKLRKLKI
jgi:TPR repeat protein